MGGRNKQMLRRKLSLGEEQAEFDGLLREAFYENWLYEDLESREHVKCFIVGRTGSGKSACFQRLTEQHSEHVITINPEDLSLTYVAGLDVMQRLTSLGVSLDPLFIALWKHVLVVEVIKNRYKVDSADAKARFLGNIRDKLRRDKSKLDALQYLEEFEGTFWNEADVRIKEVTNKFETQVKDELGVKLGLGAANLTAGLADTGTASRTDRTEIARLFQRIVNATQLPRLNKMIDILNDDILDSEQNFTYILIDDLDKDWADEQITNDLIRCLFRATYDLNKGVDNLKVLVALRTNIFDALDFGRSGGQEEKYRDLTQVVRWSSDELREMLDVRVAAAAARQNLTELSTVRDILPRVNDTMGDPFRYVIDRTLMRPRDAIAFMNRCLANANSQGKVTWRAIGLAEGDYSTNRLLALRDEWKPTYPGIDRVFSQFRGCPYILDIDGLTERLDNCALLMADPDFNGVVWMTELTTSIWSSTVDTDWVEMYQPLVRLLHNIGFLGAVLSGRDSDEPPIFNYDDPTFPDNPSNLRQVTGFMVHPTFHPALDIGKQPYFKDLDSGE
ncbi:hypothetical protein OG555_25035 [Kribbella sp. NBC_01484]|uniref:P-loop ATPase, Sll1717 family n=1 Tax=Kribbella sp. NBC_01484 TaxID=2903579 RepID=UPI002E33B251|nr:hypothetical protein [Kribbella sp. NBC_01484]